MAEITGKKMGSLENIVAVVRCSKVEGKVRQRHLYFGHHSCAGANLAFGGNQQCPHACLGFGDCANGCPFNAILIVDGFPRIDPSACVGCGTCMRACPKKLIELMPLKSRVWVPCSTREPGKQVKEACQVGCISCKMCVKSCPAEAVRMEDNIVVIDHKKCMEYESGCGEICVEKCPRHIFRKRTAQKEQGQVAA